MARDFNPRDDRGSSRGNSSGAGRSGGGAGRPRRDDDRPRRDGERPTGAGRPAGAGRPRRDDGRPSSDRPRRDGDRPAGVGRPRRDGDRPAGVGRPRRDDDRPRSDRPRRDGDRPTGAGRPRRDDDRPFSDRPRADRPRRDGDRPAGAGRPRRDDDRPRSDRPRRDGDRPTGAGRPRRDDDRPRSDRPRRDGDRPTGAGRPRREESRPGADRYTARPRPAGKPDERGGRERTNFDASQYVEVAADIDTKVLPKQVMAELRNISPAAAEYCAKHLAAAMYALEDDDAERAYKHAVAARARAARLACVREMVGLSAYHSQMWAEALNEFRTFQRLTGDPHFLPLMADCERGLGRPMKALAIARSEQVRSLDADTKIEMRIVASGARRDLGQLDAAIATLETPELKSKSHSFAVTRLRYAYAEALLAADRLAEARDWFVKTALGDVEDLTDAADRALEIDA